MRPNPFGEGADFRYDRWEIMSLGLLADSWLIPFLLWQPPGLGRVLDPRLRCFSQRHPACVSRSAWHADRKKSKSSRQIFVGTSRDSAE